MDSLRPLFRKAVQAALSGATVVTPTDRSARTLRSACEQKLQSAAKAWHTPRVLSWGALVTWVWREALMAGAVDTILLNGMQQDALWEDLVRLSAAGARLINIPGAARRAREAWQLIHAYRIPFPSPAFRSSPETTAFSDWANDYGRRCEQNHWTDNARAADVLARVAHALRPQLASLVTFGFDEFTPQQQEFLHALRGAGVHVEQLVFAEQLRLDGAAYREHVRALAANDSEDELRRAASWARVILEKTPGARLAVFVPALAQVRGIAEHVFREVLHPESYFCPTTPETPAFEIAREDALSNTGLVDCALRVLRFVAAGLSVEETSRLVRSPFLAGAAEERSARAALDGTVRHKLKAPFVSPEMLLEYARQSHAPALARGLARLRKAATQFAQPAHSGEWVDRASSVLEAVGWPGDGLDPREYHIHEDWVELLRRFATLELVRPAALTANDAVAEITRLARTRRLRAHNNNAPVQVLDFSDAVGLVFDHVWLAGMTDEAWPPRNTLNPFVPLTLQAQACIPNVTSDLQNELSARTLSRVFASAEDVIVSWPKRDKDRDLRPAAPIAEVAHARPELCTPIARGIAEYVLFAEPDLLKDETAPAAAAGVHDGGTKLFELQSTCPFHAFAEKRLGAYAVRDAYTAPNYMERGERIERVLELVWNELGNWYRLNEVFDTSELSTIVERAVKAAVHELVPQPGRWYDNFRSVEAKRLTQLTLNWLAKERERAPFDSVVHQKEIAIRVGGVEISARVDRIDTLPNGESVIIDYKTGKGFSYKSWLSPRMDRPQLPLYAIAHEPGQVAAVAFGLMRTERYELSGITRDRRLLAKNGKNGGACERDVDSVVSAWRDELEALAKAYLGGDAAVAPKLARKTCKFCKLDALCRIQEQTGASVETEDGDDDEQ